jgi:lipopolysaccharide export system protein LptC
MSGGNLNQVQHYWLPLVIVGALVLLTTWLGQLSEQHPVQAGAAPGHNPDYFVDDLHATAYDVAGTPRYHLTASKMLHYMDNDTSTLESPVFLRDGPGVPRMTARSSHGLVSANGETVTLLDEVQVTQDSETGAPPMELTTEYLKVMPNADRLSTDKPVILQQGSSVLTGNSMAADGKARTLQLSGRVKGIYEIHH